MSGREPVGSAPIGRSAAAAASDPGAGKDNWATEDGGNWLTEDGGVWLLEDPPPAGGSNRAYQRYYRMMAAGDRL